MAKRDEGRREAGSRRGREAGRVKKRGRRADRQAYHGPRRETKLVPGDARRLRARSRSSSCVGLLFGHCALPADRRHAARRCSPRLIIFGRRAQRSAYRQVEGQPGGGGAALGALRRGWYCDHSRGRRGHRAPRRRPPRCPSAGRASSWSPRAPPAASAACSAQEKKRVARVVGKTPDLRHRRRQRRGPGAAAQAAGDQRLPSAMKLRGQQAPQGARSAGPQVPERRLRATRPAAALRARATGRARAHRAR